MNDQFKTHNPGVSLVSKEKELDRLVHEIEKHQKILNCIESGNSKRRKNINNLRKERAVFDKVFKGIEMKIMYQEKSMNKQIKRLSEKDEKLRKVEKDLTQLETVIGGNHREELVKKIEKVYQENFVDYSGAEDDEEFLGELSPKMKASMFSKERKDTSTPFGFADTGNTNSSIIYPYHYPD